MRQQRRDSLRPQVANLAGEQNGTKAHRSCTDKFVVATIADVKAVCGRYIQAPQALPVELWLRLREANLA